MSTVSTGHEEAADELLRELRRMAGEALMLHQAIAERVGLHATDLRCLDLLYSAGGVTAGRLAEWTGLSTSSITAVIDRLERAGYARRARDPHDRRRVIVEPVAEVARREIAPLFEAIGRAMRELCARYSPEELALIVDFVCRSNDLTHDQIERMRGAPGGGEPESL